MTTSPEKAGKEMTNGNGIRKNEVLADENKRLRQMLQKAVKAEKSPISLRDKISKMIRER